MKNKYAKIIAMLIVILFLVMMVIGYNIKLKQQNELNDFKNSYTLEKSKVLDLEIADADIELFIKPHQDRLLALDEQILAEDLEFKQIDELENNLINEIVLIQDQIVAESNTVNDSINKVLDIKTFTDKDLVIKQQIITEANEVTHANNKIVTQLQVVDSEAPQSEIFESDVSESGTSESELIEVNPTSLSTVTQTSIDLYNNYLMLKDLKKQADELVKSNEEAIKKAAEAEAVAETAGASTVATSNVSGTTDSCEPYYAQGFLIANKNHCLSPSFNPGGVSGDTMSSWELMVAAAKVDGINLYFQSGFRSYDTQVETYNYWVSVYGEEKANQVSAKPGYSEHQTGLAIDVSGDSGCTLEECFINTPEGAWIANHAHEYGFIIRYMPGKEGITGYTYEPWHIRYVGVDTATEIYNQQTTLEEYLGIR